MAVAVDGSLLATGHDGGNVVVWDAATLDIRSRLKTGERGLAHPFFSPDAKLLAAGCQENGDVVIWNLAERQEVGRFTFEKGGLRTYLPRPAGVTFRPERDPTRFCFSPDGDAFLVGCLRRHPPRHADRPGAGPVRRLTFVGRASGRPVIARFPMPVIVSIQVGQPTDYLHAGFADDKPRTVDHRILQTPWPGACTSAGSERQWRPAGGFARTTAASKRRCWPTRPNTMLIGGSISACPICRWADLAKTCLWRVWRKQRLHRRPVAGRRSALRGLSAPAALLENVPPLAASRPGAQVVANGRGGWYLGVLTEGELAAETPFMLVERPHPTWTVSQASEIFHRRKDDLAGAASWPRCRSYRRRGGKLCIPFAREGRDTSFALTTLPPLNWRQPHSSSWVPTMATNTPASGPAFGSSDLRLPDELRGPLLAHLADLRERYVARGWAGRVGFGSGRR